MIVEVRFTVRFVETYVFTNGGQCCRCKALQKVWDAMWLFLDPWAVVGLRTSASVWDVPKEVWTSWRALPSEERASGPQGDGVLEALHPSGEN